jgi:ATP-binding cassette subfamily C (CFTR/MRP) protein 1
LIPICHTLESTPPKVRIDCQTPSRPNTSPVFKIFEPFGPSGFLISWRFWAIGVEKLLTNAGLINTVMRFVLICITAKYFATAIPFALICVYLIQRYYLRTSRQLRFLDIEAKAPLYSQFIETLDGLPTIRAFGWQHSLQRRNHRLLDTSQKPFYLLACIQLWLTFTLDILTAVLAILVVVLAVSIKDSTTGGDAGVALVNVLSTNQVLAM